MDTRRRCIVAIIIITVRSACCTRRVGAEVLILILTLRTGLTLIALVARCWELFLAIRLVVKVHVAGGAPDMRADRG